MYVARLLIDGRDSGEVIVIYWGERDRTALCLDPDDGSLEWVSTNDLRIVLEHNGLDLILRRVRKARGEEVEP